MLSRRSKEAFKTSLAMVIAYGVAMGLGWDKPYWAAFAVGMISLATVGHSLNKGLMRMMGTLFAIVISLSLLALLPQQRWPFLLLLSLFVSFCAFMMTTTKHFYFWQVSGFVTGIITLESGFTGAGAFEIAMLRAQETGLGILVYTLVSVLLWPQDARQGFYGAVLKLSQAQHALFQNYRQLMAHQSGMTQGEQQDSHQCAVQLLGAQTQFSNMLDAALTDTYEVVEQKQAWHRYARLVALFSKAMARWSESLAEVSEQNLTRYLPNLEVYCQQQAHNLAMLAQMLETRQTVPEPPSVELEPDLTTARELSHFERAAVEVTRHRLLLVGRITGALFNTMREIQDYRLSRSLERVALPETPLWWSDPERITVFVRMFVTLWMAYLLVIFVEDLPGGIVFAVMTISMGLAIAWRPQATIRSMVIPLFGSTLATNLLYIFVMPQLDSYLQLSVLIFLYTFVTCYLFYLPQQVMTRALVLIFFTISISIANQQTYSFLLVANNSLMFVLALLLLGIGAQIPVQARPERWFIRLLRRYFRSCVYLLGETRARQLTDQSRWSRWKRDFHRHEVATLPDKLMSWVPFLDIKHLGLESPDQVKALVASIRVLATQILELQKERLLRHPPYQEEHLQGDMKVWREQLQQRVQQLALLPDALDAESFRRIEAGILQQLETGVETVLNNTPEDQVDGQDNRNLYRILGTYRSISEALMDYADKSQGIVWSRWREARF